MSPLASVPTSAHVVFVVVTLVTLVAPLVATLVMPAAEATGREELAAWPSTTDASGALNMAYLAELGSWFEDHHALRDSLVEADARLRLGLLQAPPASSVVVGTNGWLYYYYELGDYQRTSLMSSRAIFNAVHNVALMQECVEEAGGAFAIAIVPNKSTLYPEHLPPWLLAGEGADNYERFAVAAASLGVNVVELRDALAEAGATTGRTLYYSADTHWNNEGARVGANALLAAVGSDACFDGEGATVPVGHVGDLAEMLLPSTSSKDGLEVDLAYADAQRFSWVEGAGDVTASTIVTEAMDVAAGEAVVFRDSFGNALVPYLGSAFARTTFSKLVPYDFGLVGKSSTAVMVVRAERHMTSLATTPPYLLSPTRDIDLSKAVAHMGEATLSARVNGPYIQLGGTIDVRRLMPGALVYVSVSDTEDASTMCDAFLVSSQAESTIDVEPASEPGADEVFGDAGYRAFLSASAYDFDKATARVYVAWGDSLACVAEARIADVLVQG